MQLSIHSYMEASHLVTYKYSKNNMFSAERCILYQHIKGYSKNDTFPSSHY